MKTDPHDGFLQAIIDSPDEDAPRLRYADWLEETSEPGFVAYAEYIRLSCRIAAEKQRGLSPDSSLVQRAHFLLFNHVRKWNGLVHRRLRSGPLRGQVDSR